MPPTRRLTGIAALSAGALATVGLATPAAAADAPGDEPAALPTEDAVPQDLMHKWEATRGIDLPDDLLLKLEGTDGEAPPDGALIKWEYQPSGDTDGLLIKYEYAPGEDPAGDAFIKVEYAPGDVDRQAALREMDDALHKVEAIIAEADPDAFLKLEGTDGESVAPDPFIKWEYAPGDAPATDAFIKLELPAVQAAAEPALIKWEYDALDLVEGALLKMETSSLEGDPDQPLIAGLLDQVADLRAAPQRINPFVNRDKGMKGLPLPKKLPADAGTFGTPRAGLWRSVNLPGTVTCEGYSQRIPRSVSDAVRLELQDGGATIVGYDLAEPGSKVTLSADSDIQGRFTGTLEMDSEGGRIDMDLTMQVITDEHTVGSATITVKGGGQTCTITRRFDMTYQGR